MYETIIVRLTEIEKLKKLIHKFEIQRENSEKFKFTTQTAVEPF